MPTKQLMGVWIFLDICLLVAGVVSIVFSQLFGMPDLVLNFTISKADLTGPCYALPFASLAQH
jgi:hypothetical protein